MKKSFSPELKARVALEALKEDKTINELSGAYGAHPTQIHVWKKQVKEGLANLFRDKRGKHEQNQQALIDELYRLIGQRDTELAWLKKKLHLDS